MKQAIHLFTDEQKEKINQAVQQAETGTDAEIVPAVATASGRYDRPEDIVGLWLGIIGMVVAWFLLPAPSNDTGSWGGGWPACANLLILCGVLVLGFFVGTLLAMRICWLRRLFTSRKEMADEVAARATEIFATRGVYKTENATGLLIYVSLFERLARIQADQTITEKLGQDTLDALCEQLTCALRSGHPTEAFRQTIAAAGEKLTDVLPKSEGNPDELSNQLLIIE